MVKTKTQPFELVNLENVINIVLDNLETLILQNHGRVEVNQMPTLDADKVQMQQLFQNLIANAIKFHKKEESPIVIITSQQNGHGYWEISVEDNGIGFDEKCIDRIYKLFQRLHGRHEYDGTGIGLAICKKIVDLHGGTIDVKSSPRQGSTFIVTLPEKQTNTSV